MPVFNFSIFILFSIFQTKTKILTMIPYSQLTGKISGGESIRVTGCTCHEDTWDKFRFSVSGEDLTEAGQGMVTHTVQVTCAGQPTICMVLPTFFVVRLTYQAWLHLVWLVWFGRTFNIHSGKQLKN